jgi:hypothetical protein
MSTWSCLVNAEIREFRGNGHTISHTLPVTMLKPHTILRHLPACRFLTLWAINDRLCPDRLRRQLDDMKALGFDGAVFHPRFYPNDPPYLGPAYLAIVSRTILHARDIGLAFWLYDENGWPSGVADGKVLRDNPAHGGAWLAISPTPTHDSLLSVHVDRRGHVAASPQVGGRTLHLQPQRSVSAIDYLSPQPCRRFLELTHDAYRTRLDPAAWDHVEAIFTDEPEFGLGHAYDRLPPDGAIPWTDALPGLYHQRTGREVMADLPLVIARSEGCEEARVRFWEFMTDLLCEGFFAPYYEWCDRHGKLFAGHLKGDEHPLFQVMMNGSCHRSFQHMHLPGVDPLERLPINHYFARQVASAAAQFGSGRAMAECMGGAGWGTSPEDVERYFLWLTGHGINDLVVHLWQYRLNSQAIRDWPPSHPNHFAWRQVYPHLLQKVRDTLRTSPPPKPDTLVVAPYRGIMAQFEPWEVLQTNVHNAGTYPDTPAGRINTDFMALVQRLHDDGVACHFTDERSFEESAKVCSGSLTLNRWSYRKLQVHPGCRWRDTGLALLKAADAAGLRASLDARDTGAIAIASEEEPPSLTLQVCWQLASHPESRWLLASEPVQAEQHALSFEGMCEGPICLITADPLAEARLNDHPLVVRQTDEGSVAEILPQHMQAVNRAALRYAGPIFQPMVWLQGVFCVHSRSAWREGGARTVYTQGPLFMGPPACIDSATADVDVTHLLFAGGPVELSTSVRLPHALPAGSRWRLDQVQADAARLTIDEHDLGWTWGPHWEVVCPTPLPAGIHRVTLRLMISSFNTFGPHHHYAGDPLVTSPEQFRGRRNFADPIDAPACTNVTGWHLRPVRVPATLSVKRGSTEVRGTHPK